MTDIAYTEIANRIMQKAREAGIPSERALCLQAGVNANFVRAIRIGKTRSPRGDSLQKVASLLKVSVDWILTGHEESAPVTKDTSPHHGRQIADRALQKGLELGYKSERAICLAAGVSPDFLRHLRIGKVQSPRAESLSKVAALFQVSMDWMLTGDDTNPPNTREIPNSDSGNLNSILGQWMSEVLEKTGWSAAHWAKLAETAPSNITRMIRDPSASSRPRIDTLMKLARAVPAATDIEAPAFLNLPEETHEIRPPSSSQNDKIIEVDVLGGMGGGGIALTVNYTDDDGNTYQTDDVKALWDLPSPYLTELRVSATNARIIEVQGDSMEPTLRPGDRVMINIADKRPSPPGVFAVWDGFGIVVKRLEPIPNSDPPTLRLISDNEKHSAYERTLDEVCIVGRVVWFGRRM